MVDDDALNEMVVVWISTVEKTRHNSRISKRVSPKKRQESIKTIAKPAKLIFNWSSYPCGPSQPKATEATLARLDHKKFRTFKPLQPEEREATLARLDQNFQDLLMEIEAEKMGVAKVNGRSEITVGFELSDIVMEDSKTVSDELAVFLDGQ